VRPELRADTSTLDSLTAYSMELLQRTAEPFFWPNDCKTELFGIRTNGREVRVIRDKMRSETALSEFSSLWGSDGGGKTARKLGFSGPVRPISLVRKEMLAEGERFEPPVRFHVLSKQPATQNLSQNTDGSAFAR
jgi:hypothetical protein